MFNWTDSQWGRTSDTVNAITLKAIHFKSVNGETDIFPLNTQTKTFYIDYVWVLAAQVSLHLQPNDHLLIAFVRQHCFMDG